DEYKIIAYTIHFKWDPTLLELQPIKGSDQVETEVGNKGTLFLPQAAAFETARQKGDIGVGWIGILGANQGAITPGINKLLLNLFFKPRAPDTPAGAIATIDLVDPPGDQYTSVIPDTVPNDGPPLEARFDGAIDIAPALDIPTIASVSPLFGSLAGGAEGTISGYGFLAGGTEPARQGQGALVDRPARAPPIPP